MKKNLVLSLLLLLVLLCEKGFSQVQYEFVFNGKVTDYLYRGIGGALVKNLRTQDVSITDTSGIFSIALRWNDSLFIHAMGYEIKVQTIKPGLDRILKLNTLSVQLNIVDVVTQKDWDDFKKEFLAEDLPADKINRDGLPEGKINPVPPQYRSNEFQHGPTFGNFILNPFSSIATVMNNKEKEKKKIRKILDNESAQEVYWSAVREDSIKKYMEIPDSLMVDFIVYCNANIDDKYLQSAYYYQELILSLYPKFIEERKKKSENNLLQR